MNDSDKGITEKLIDEILDNVKLLLGITDSKKDELLTLYIKILCNNILIKTNRRTFVSELKYVVAQLTMDLFDSNNKENPELNSIQSMSEYDRSVTFGANDIVKYKLNLIVQKQLEDNEKLINRFKLLYRA